MPRALACSIRSSIPLMFVWFVPLFIAPIHSPHWIDYLREAHRTVKPFGHLFVVEPRQRWEHRVSELSEAVEAAGFRLIGDVEQRYEFLYLTAVRE